MAELTLSHTFYAPREMVWKLWTDPQHAVEWWGPEDFTCPRYDADLRPGGAYYFEMQAPDGTIYPSRGVYRDVTAPQRLVFEGTAEANGAVLMQVRTSLRFDEVDRDTTRLAVEQDYQEAAPEAAFAREGAPTGWQQMLKKFEAYLLKHRESA